jgi:hypothetical protein
MSHTMTSGPKDRETEAERLRFAIRMIRESLYHNDIHVRRSFFYDVMRKVVEPFPDDPEPLDGWILKTVTMAPQLWLSAYGKIANGGGVGEFHPFRTEGLESGQLSVTFLASIAGRNAFDDICSRLGPEHGLPMQFLGPTTTTRRGPGAIVESDTPSNVGHWHKSWTPPDGQDE